MKTQLWAMGIILFSTLLTSTAQLFYKFGASKLRFDFLSLITNYELLMGLFLYAIGGILLILSFRGGEVSVLYPIFATSYIWVSFMSIYFLGEIMNLFKWGGVIAIVGGIALIGFGSNNFKSGKKVTQIDD
jgi:drug/metabolite transporter (DMT)-like permease